MLSSLPAGVSSALQYVTAAATGAGKPHPKEFKEIQLSEHGFEDFAEIFSLNDRIAFELQDNPEDGKIYELNPPRVSVFGSTSAGKSSLLERIIGYRIFPVRDTVCTRRPFAVRMRNDPTAERTTIRFLEEGKEAKVYFLPEQIEQVREYIEVAQGSRSDDVKFSTEEIRAEISSKSCETFTFTDLPGIFLTSEKKLGSDYASSREANERLKQHTMEIAKKYLLQPNTICLVVISSTDWMHGINNDALISHLAEWLEEARKERDVPVYGVITKLDLHDALSPNSVVKKALLGQLGKDHILNGLRVRRWIPVVSSPDLLSEPDKAKAAAREIELVHKCLRGCVPPLTLSSVGIGRSLLLKQLKQALLTAIGHAQADMRGSIDKFIVELAGRLEKLPHQAPATEKQRIFDTRLKVLETSLQDSIGARGRQLQGSSPGVRSFLMQLMVDAPAQFERNLAATSLRGDLVAEVAQIRDQAALEQGGSFDSDLSFAALSEKVLERFKGPCLTLVDTCARIIRSALREAVQQAFGEYRELEKLILATLGVAPDESQEHDDPEGMFGFLKTAATHKVLSLLEGFATMACFHPMWRNFDTLYQTILLRDPSEAKQQKGAAEDSLQRILDLPALAKRVRDEGEAAIAAYERETRQAIPAQEKTKISRHFGRVEVMAYIIRQSLTSAVFPLVLRDMRDGLFRGVKHGALTSDHSIATLLRMRLVFDREAEKKVFQLMDPSPEDIALRARLTKKRETLISLRADFDRCQGQLRQLMQLINATNS